MLEIFWDSISRRGKINYMQKRHQQDKTKNIICLMGPTASGKTALALDLVQQFSLEIISVDSGMIYRGMDIGTAKPTKKEQTIAPHRLIDICDPSETYSAARFRQDAICEIEDILWQGKTPFLVGGTMLYFKVLQQGISPLPQADAKVRAELKAMEQEKGVGSLYAKLQQVDSATAARLSSQDSQRIQRALEVYTITGQPISVLCANSPPEPSPYNFVNIALMPTQRNLLHERIAQRIQLMLRQGFVEEVEKLFRRGDLHIDLPAMRAVGYRQVWQHISGEIDYNTMQERILFATRQLAKRQLVWLKSWSNLTLVDAFESPLLQILQKINTISAVLFAP